MKTRRHILGTAAAMTVAPSVLRAAPEKIRIGQIGTGHAHALGKLDAILKYPEVFEFVGIAEPDESRKKEAIDRKKAYGDLNWITEEELLASPGLQAVAVETPVPELVSTALRCIRAGKHIHLDKPAGESLEACRELHGEAGRRNLTIQMGYMLRYNPGFQFLFDAVEKGWLGEITEVSGMMGKKMSDHGRKHLARFDGGGMFELACHLIDAVVYLLGAPERVTSVSHRTYPEKDTFADNQLAVLDYEKAIATVRCNHIDPLGFQRREFSVTGTEGTLRIHPLEPGTRIELGLDRPRGDYQKGFQTVNLTRPPGRYDAEFLDLAKVIRGEKTLAWDAAHDVATHEAVLRASGVLK